MASEPLPYPNPSEASETPSLLPISLPSPLKKDDIEPIALLMYTERPALFWNLCLTPTKKNSRVEPEEESEMREGTGLRRGGASPCQEFGRGTGTRVAQPDRTDLEAKLPLLANPSALLHEGHVCQEIGLVAFMFFFELLFFLCCSQFPSMFPLLTYFLSFLFLYLLITRDIQDEGKARFDSISTGTV